MEHESTAAICAIKSLFGLSLVYLLQSLNIV
jgi:hypothetical protein